MVSNSIFIIDAGYLSFITKFLGKGEHLKFKIEDFVRNISKKANTTCKIVHFYTAPPYKGPKPTENEKQRQRSYDKFILKLREIKNPFIVIKEGRCQRIINEKGKVDYSQKGVDTLITMDLLKLSLNKEYDKILILTSDTDFVPVIEDIKKEKQVVLVYFTDRKRKSGFTLSNHLWNVCDKKIRIGLTDFLV